VGDVRKLSENVERRKKKDLRGGSRGRNKLIEKKGETSLEKEKSPK